MYTVNLIGFFLMKVLHWKFSVVILPFVNNKIKIGGPKKTEKRKINGFDDLVWVIVDGSPAYWELCGSS